MWGRQTSSVKTSTNFPCEFFFLHLDMADAQEPEQSALSLEQPGGSLLKSHTRSDGAGSGSSSSPLKCLAAVLGLLALGLLAMQIAEQRRPPASHCLGGWPVFDTQQSLEASRWGQYLKRVYGAIPAQASAYPMCIGDLWLLYTAAVEDTLLDADLPDQPISSCPPSQGSIEGTRYIKHSLLTNAGGANHSSWIWHPRSDGFAALDAGEWVEIAHKGGIPDEHVGAWFLAARGSGIWLNTGAKTVAFDDHVDAYAFFNVTNVTFKDRNEAMASRAVRAGYDSIQFVRHTCMMMYKDCLNTSLANLSLFNIEIVATRLQGIHPWCAHVPSLWCRP